MKSANYAVFLDYQKKQTFAVDIKIVENKGATANEGATETEARASQTVLGNYVRVIDDCPIVKVIFFTEFTGEVLNLTIGMRNKSTWKYALYEGKKVQSYNDSPPYDIGKRRIKLPDVNAYLFIPVHIVDDNEGKKVAFIDRVILYVTLARTQ